MQAGQAVGMRAGGFWFLAAVEAAGLGRGSGVAAVLGGVREASYMVIRTIV